MRPRPDKPELLSPAGSPEALAAALASGADAVYFGLRDGFNARARAANFALEELPGTVARIHRAGARAYLALNTLVFESELEALERILRAAARSGIDALIVQDPAVCLLARALCPALELHGSTQMTVSSAGGAELAAALGVRRIVVPRELVLEEIERLAGETDLELEVFIHGALCVSWSGQCLTSEAWGGRSANRGQCAQSCRMPYDLVVDGETRELGEMRYLLSPRDLAGLERVDDLARIGVHGLKIEGRQKGPQYVATATAGYRRAIDAVAAGGARAADEERRTADRLAMSLSYSRGFGEGFLAGTDHQTLVDGRFPKHRGVLLGTVARVLDGEVQVERAEPRGALEPRAGLGVVFDGGNPEDSDEPGGPIFAVEAHGELLLLRFGRPGPDLSHVRPGDRVWVTNDPALSVATERLVRGPEPAGRVRLDLVVCGGEGRPLVVEGRAGTEVARVASAVPLERAHHDGLDLALLADKLAAFGGTPFHLGGLDTSGLDGELYLPPAELKRMRRALVGELLQQIERGPERALDPRPALPRVRAELAALPPPQAPTPADVSLVPLVRDDEQLAAVIDAGLREVELDWMELVGLGRAVERARAAGLAVVVATLRIGKPGEEANDEHLLRLAPDGVLVRHWGALMRCRAERERGARLALHGDFSLNVTNSLTARHLLRLGLDTLTPAHDLDGPQLRSLLEGTPAERVTLVGHLRIPTFHTEHCVYAHLLSEGRDHRTCGRPCERHRVAVQDHLGRRHPIVVDVGCRNTVFHCAPQQSAELAAELVPRGVRRVRIELVRESGREVERVLAAWRDLLAGRATAAELAARTGAEAQCGVARGGMAVLIR